MADAVGLHAGLPRARGTCSRGCPTPGRPPSAELVVPLRHYESGAQMISCDVTRFGFGTTITQCAGFAAFDRIGNAQAISRRRHRPRWRHRRAARRGEDPLGRRRLAAGPAALRGGAVPREGLGQGPRPARRRSTASSTRLFFTHLDDAAIDAGRRLVQPVRAAPGRWFKDQRKWLDALYKAWVADPRDRRREQGAARRDHHRRRSTRPRGRRAARAPGRRARRRRCCRSTSRPLPPPCATPSRR